MEHAAGAARAQLVRAVRDLTIVRALFTVAVLWLSLSLASILVGGEPNSQSKSATEAPTLEQILDKYVEALGGRAALAKVNSRASKGTFTSINLKTKGPIEIYAKAPTSG